MSYSDKSFVSDEYGRELSGTRTQAIEVERVSDDPPDRIQAWLVTVNDDAMRQLVECCDTILEQRRAVEFLRHEIEERVVLGSGILVLYRLIR